MKYSVEMGSGAMIYIHCTRFHKDWFSHSKVDRGDSQTHRQHGDWMSLFLFFQNKESRLKTEDHHLERPPLFHRKKLFNSQREFQTSLALPDPEGTIVRVRILRTKTW
jgi:hypothetical protein